MKFEFKFEFEFSFEFMFEKMIYNKTKFKNNEICVIRLLKMIKINDVKKIKRALKPKSFLLIINFNNDSKVNCFEIRMKSTQKFKTKSLSLSLSLSLFKKCLKIYKVSRI